ncbi:MAG: hypothetical protein ABWY28_23580, partial [Pseudomonas prosekii]
MLADTPLSQASSAPTGVWVEYKSSAHHKSLHLRWTQIPRPTTNPCTCGEYKSSAQPQTLWEQREIAKKRGEKEKNIDEKTHKKKNKKNT